MRKARGIVPDGASSRTFLTPKISYIAVYDPIGRRMLMQDGVDTDGAFWSLSLHDRVEWTKIVPSGNGPVEYRDMSAVYDARHRRLVILGFANSDSSADVFAVELDKPLEWHRFCSPGTKPSGGDRAILAADGLLTFAYGGAPFRFSLNTPYCDGE